MNEKTLSLFLIVCASIAAIVCVIIQNLDLAIFFLMILFTLTNLFRSRKFLAKGHVKEAKWLKNMSIFFALLSLVILFVVLI